MSDDFFIRLERQLQAAELRELNRGPVLRRFVNARRLLSVPLAARAAVGVVVVALVAVVVTVWPEPEVEIKKLVLTRLPSKPACFISSLAFFTS